MLQMPFVVEAVALCNVAHVQPINLQNFQKMCFSQKAPVASGLN